MTARLASLRVNLSRVRSEGFTVEIEPPYIPPTLRQWGRRKDLPNVTQAVAAYQASDKSRGTLSRIAVEFKTTPGTIMCRMRRKCGVYQRELTPGFAPSASHSS